jgi:hypothetical protein
MSLPKSLVQPLRQNQLTVGSGWRAYFAPFNQQQAVATANTSIGPTIYDMQVTGRFIDTPTGTPAGWFDLGWIKNFKFTPGSKTGNVMTGYRGAIRAKYRAETSEKMSVLFMESSRTVLRIASGTQVFNLLKSTATASLTGPLSSSGIAAVAMGASGYQPSSPVAGASFGLPTLFVPAGSGAAFAAGTYIVCDQDYNNTSYGFVGDAGANVFQGAVSDVDFIRKTSDYVACVSQVIPSIVSGQDGLVLTAAFMGGGNSLPNVTANTAPTTGAKVQAIIGYAAREGGTYISEWSAILVLQTVEGSQYMFYYPRLAPDQFQGFTDENLQNATSMQTSGVTASFDSLAFDDPEDGETIVAYRGYYPAPSHTIQV